VRYLGSARGGLGEWQLQRWTALALIPLGLYFAGSILRLANSDRATAIQWFSGLVPALFVMLLRTSMVTG
jgi:succinate dehydrogenase / fumarate reductase membrane anchor subunit